MFQRAKTIRCLFNLLALRFAMSVCQISNAKNEISRVMTIVRLLFFVFKSQYTFLKCVKECNQ